MNTRNNTHMKRILFAAVLLVAFNAAVTAQTTTYTPGVSADGAVYFLPKTVLRVAIRVETTVYTPGELCKYAEKYLKMKDVSQEPSTTCRVVAMDLTTYGVADTAKCYTMKLNPKSAATNVRLSDGGVLLAINTDPKKMETPVVFAPSKREEQVNPKQYLNEEILEAGSTAKTAELTALEIYDIRDSRNMLTRGQADFMPTDGEQLRLMLAQLDKQDRALTSLFTGTTVTDTAEYVVEICPEDEIDKVCFFRLSNKLGVVDNDDLAGAPFYISVDDMHAVPAAGAPADGGKKSAKTEGVYVNVPGKVRVTIYQGVVEAGCWDIYAAQFGYVDLLSNDLFYKHPATKLTLNPATGSILKLDAELPTK